MIRSFLARPIQGPRPTRINFDTEPASGAVQSVGLVSHDVSCRLYEPVISRFRRLDQEGSRDAGTANGKRESFLIGAAAVFPAPVVGE